MARNFLDFQQVVPIVNFADHNGVAIDGSTYLLGDAVNMQNYNHATIIIVAGSMTGTPAVTLKQSLSALLGTEQALAFDKVYINSEYGSQNEYTETTVTSDTFDISATNYTTYIIEVAGNTLDRADGYYWLRLNVATDANSNTFGAICILSEPNYAAGPGDMPSAII